MKHKKLTAAVLVLTMLLICSSVYAAGTPTISVSYPENAEVGETIKVEVRISNNPGIYALDVRLGYNTEVLNCLTCDTGDAISNMMAATNPQSQSGALLSAASLTPSTKDGALAVMTFKVLAKGDYGFSLSDVVLADSTGTNYDYQLSNITESSNSGSNGGGAQNSPALPFIDIAGHWAQDYIVKSYEKALIEGYGNGKYGPDDNMTRAQFVTILWRFYGEPEPNGESGFTDLDPKQTYYHKAVAWAEENGVVLGVGGGRFDPKGNVTREQIAVILHRLSGETGGAEMLYASIYDKAFTDSKDIAVWARSAVYWAIYREIWCGTDSTDAGTELFPNEPAARSEITVMIVRYQENI